MPPGGRPTRGERGAARPRPGPGAVTGLHLVRHGQSTWNAAGLLQGCTAGVPLTARGRAQAAAVAAALAGRDVAAVISSDQVRAMSTAGPIAAAHGLAVVSHPALREQCHGAWEGLPAAGRAGRLAAARTDWAPPGGESARDLRTRVARFVHDLLGDPPPGEIVLVSHGETIRALAAVIGSPGVEATPGNGAVLTLRPGRADVSWARPA